MATVPLPDEPDIGQLRNQAKDLQRSVRTGDPAALAEIAERHPGAPFGPADTATFPLSAAQLVVARRHGFVSWTRLKHHVEVVVRHSRFPDRADVDDTAGPADRFLRAACLTYGDDDPARWAEAAALLAAHPGLSAGDVYVAAATADVAALRAALAADPGAARREGGPHRWEPLVYLAYARHDPAVTEADVLASAVVLLDAGADPDAGYLWHGLCSPFTVLTGVFGGGEAGPFRQPRHPHSPALARLLLDAGADPNDAQALYNRMFEPDDEHLELLFEFGLGTGDGGPWRRRLGDAVEAPAALLRRQLAWAVTHGMVARVRLLADHGVDIVTPFDDGATPVSLAATSGHPAVVDHLVGRGAPRPALSPGEAFVAAALAVDREAIERLRAEHPGLVDRVRARRPGLVVWAAGTGRAGAVELLVELGFDVDGMGRTDVARNEPWQTALHAAVEDGNVDLARTLLRLGANPDITDARFDGTPLDWARHFERPELVELLTPATPAPPTGATG
jgi:ankyrin repeat protein